MKLKTNVVKTEKLYFNDLCYTCNVVTYTSTILDIYKIAYLNKITRFGEVVNFGNKFNVFYLHIETCLFDISNDSKCSY